MSSEFDSHPVDRLSAEELREILFRVDATGFPADIREVWAKEHLRFRETLRRIPPARDDSQTLLDLGCSRGWVPFLRALLNYRRIFVNTSYPESGFVMDRQPVRGVDTSEVRLSVFDVERERFPFADASMDVVTCLEVLEHLAIDPMAMMVEVNRVLKPGGLLVLTTPNVVRCRNIVNALLGEHPMGWSSYNGFDTNRHNREYTPSEIGMLLAASGMDPAEITTFGSKDRGRPRNWLEKGVAFGTWLLRPIPGNWRKDVILASARKVGAPRDRRPSWLYFDMAERKNLGRSVGRHQETLAHCGENPTKSAEEPHQASLVSVG